MEACFFFISWIMISVAAWISLHIEELNRSARGSCPFWMEGLTDGWISDIVALMDKSLKAKTRLSVLVKSERRER